MPLERPFLTLYPIGFLAALALAAALTPFAAILAERLGLVAAPRADRWHNRPTPLLGGIAIFAAIAVAFIILPQPNQEDPYERLGFLLLGAVGMFALGLYDDLRRLPPYTKLLGQIIAACLLVVGQMGTLSPSNIGPLIVPFAIFWIVGVTNAFNLLDNMDGLAAGIALVVGLTLFGLSHLHGDRQVALLALIVAGSAAGFLVHNFNPARVFMGDSGSLVLGYLLSGLTLVGATRSTSGVALTMLIPVAVMALPILDTSLVAILRTLNGRSVAQGGRDHLSHRLVALGLSERQAVLALYLVATITGVLAVASPLIGVWTTLTAWVVIATALVLFGVYLGQVRIYTEADFQRMGGTGRAIGRVVLGGRYLLYKQQLATMFLDLLLVTVSLLGAYLLQHEDKFDGYFQSQFAVVLPIAVSVKLAVFLALGVYRSVWRHTGLADAWLTVRACVFGCVLTAAIVLVLLGQESFPRGVLVIDWLLLTLVMVGSRRSLDLMHHVVTESQGGNARRVLIVGIGDAGDLVLRTLQRSKRRMKAVGFLDDRGGYVNRTVHGVRVLGRLEDLASVARRYQVDEVIVALASERIAQTVILACKDLEIPARDLMSFIKAELQAEPEPTALAV